MPLAKQIVIVGITDAKFKIGANLTDIGGIEELDLDFEGEDQLVKGDDGVIAYISSKTNAKVTVKSAILDLKAIAALTGDTITDTGTSPNQISTLDLKAGVTQIGTLEGQATIVQGLQGVTDTTPGDVHFKIPVFRMTANTLKLSAKIGNALSFDFAGVAIPDSTGKIASIILNETKTTIS
jgi:hypothetical protein